MVKFLPSPQQALKREREMQVTGHETQWTMGRRKKVGEAQSRPYFHRERNFWLRGRLNSVSGTANSGKSFRYSNATGSDSLWTIRLPV